MSTYELERHLLEGLEKMQQEIHGRLDTQDRIIREPKQHRTHNR